MRLLLLTKESLPEMLEIEKLSHVDPWSEEVFAHCFKAKYCIWGLEIEHKLVGFIMYSYQVQECHILNLCVHPDFQGKGYGRQLLEYGLKKVHEKGAAIAFLEVRRSNKVALFLYNKMGFIQIGERKNYYQVPSGREDAILLAKDLGVA